MTRQQFKPLDYQRVAAEAVVDCFEGQPRLEGLSYQIDPGRSASAQAAMFGETGFRNAPLRMTDAQLLQNIRRVQTRQHLTPSTTLWKPQGRDKAAAPINLDIEMETGTGKTYVYIDTMYRLYERYGWSKFIVVVPSVAIREGVAKTFDDTEAHFQERYGHKVRRFIYDSGRPEPILAYSDSPGLHCMIINTQAFLAEANAEDGGSARLRMFREMDAFQSRRPIDLIAGNHPILILDEPQRMSSAATLESLSRFKAPIALHYSATHKIRHDLVHRLDALDAYTRKLVKRINVRGVTVKGLTGVHGYLYLSDFRISADKPPEARVDIETVQNSGTVKRIPRWLKRGDDLYALSGGLAAYEGYTVSEINALDRTVAFTNGVVAEEGEVQGQTDEVAVRRVQIRETIRAHLERERLLHHRGIKVLSLFFIDEVARYRQYDANGEPKPGLYAQMFEEEYAEALAALPALDATDEAWLRYVRRDAPSSVHEGYFSVDKAKRLVDPAVNARGEEKGEAKDVSSYDLILKRKDLLLSLDEPVRFIFSHSALREGWDNPNVFTICTLKQSDHEIGKRQEVGRGLRISVDTEGRRTDGTEVHDINVLTVVASESYEAFAKGLQDELTEALKGRPTEASVAYFTGKTIQGASGERVLTQQDADLLRLWLYKHDFIDERNQIMPKWHEARDTDALPPLPEALAPDAEGVIALVNTVLDPSALSGMTGNGRRQVTPRVRKANLEKLAFQELWSRISAKAVYFTDFDTDRLVKAAVRRLDQDLRVDRQLIIVSGAELKNTIDVEDLRAGRGFAEETARFEHEQAAVATTVRYDLVGELAAKTRLTRGTVGRILKDIRQDTFALFAKNPEMFIRGAAELIRREKTALAIETLRYEKTGDHHEAAIFETDQKPVSIDSVIAAGKHVLDHVAYDSSNERAFAERLEAAEEVVVYAKLPKGFSIPTPGGNYNPDWAIAVETPQSRSLYFVAETKGSALKEALRADEKQRIDSAKAYFQDVAGQVTFEQMASYDELMQLIVQDQAH